MFYAILRMGSDNEEDKNQIRELQERCRIMDARRGYEPEDDSNFSSEAVEILRNVSRHVTYLINEGYNLKRSVIFAGDHYLLSKRQRLAVMRSVATEGQLKERRYKLAPSGNHQDVDKVLYEKGLVISSDSIILDNCRSRANLTAEYMSHRNLAGIKVW